MWAGGGRDRCHSSRFGAALSEGVSADDWGRSAEGPRRCMGYLWILGGRRAVREERSEDGVTERREERGGGQGGGRDDAEVRARSEDGRERERAEGSEVRARAAAVAVSCSSRRSDAAISQANR